MRDYTSKFIECVEYLEIANHFVNTIKRTTRMKGI